MTPLILGIIGMPACGKSTIAEHLKKNAAYIHLSDFIWKQLKKQNIKKTNMTGSMYGLYMHEIYKDKPIIKWTDQQIKKHSKSKVILLDSVRAMAHHIHLKNKHKNYKLIAVLASPEERFKRTKKRKRFGEKITRKIFNNRDKDELERDIGNVIALSDYYIDANGSKVQMLEETDRKIRTVR